MRQYFLEQFKESKGFMVATILFIALSLWWLSIYLRFLTEGIENDLFTNLLILFPLFGGIAGLYYAKLWGGLKSKFGMAIFSLSSGLLAQFIGTLLYNYYIYILGIEVPYPSIGDVFFYVSVLLYILGAYQLAKVLGVQFSSQSFINKFVAILIPFVALLGSYLILLREYDFTDSTPLLIFLDFGWQIGQVIYISIALFTLFISNNSLGGLMRKPIILLIAALTVQFISDFQFSYQVNNETWYVGGFNDYVFMLSLYLMTLAIFSIGNIYYKIQKS